MHHLIYIVFLCLSFTAINIEALEIDTNSERGNLYIKNLGTCSLENNKLIKNCKIGYRVWGEMNADLSNIIIFPTWHNGTTESLYKYNYIGPEGIVDTDDYFVIALELFGNGISSSPSNTSLEDGEDFPEFTIKDIVRSQYRLLSEAFNIENVHAVVGVSMGGHVTYEWMMQYPNFASKFLPIEGAPWHTNYDKLLYAARKNALESNFKSKEEIQKATEIITALDGLMLWTPEYVEREFGAQEFNHWFQRLQKRGNTKDYLINRESQNNALISHDIRENGELSKEQIIKLKKIDIFSIIFSSDLMVLPQPNNDLANKVGFNILSIDGDCGHMGPEVECYQDQVKEAVKKFLIN